MLVFFCVAHGLVCILAFLFVWTGRQKARTLILPTVVFVPVFGLLVLLMEEYAQRREIMGEKEIGIEKLKIKDAKYRRIDVDEGENQDITVPLEEAILVNDTGVRRKLMLDILHKNPEEYIDLLQRARLGSDAELTHYATTTMMEIQSSFELNLQKLSRELSKKPEDVQILKRYGKELERYINSGLIAGNIRMIYRSQWNEVLQSLLKQYKDHKGYRLKKIDNQIAAENYEGIEEQLSEAEKRWPKDEAVCRLYVDYYRNIGRGDLIAERLRRIKQDEVYLSHEGKKWFAFWNREE